MRKLLLYFSLNSLLIFALIVSNVSAFGQCPIPPANVTIPCGGSTTMAATTNAVNYSVTATSCAPVPITGTNAFPTPCDDCVTGSIPIGFPFNFYGNIYNNVEISSNGLVGFGGMTFTGYTPFSIPNTGTPNNYIAGFMCDIDIRNGGTITYQLTGVAPNRRFVISYNNVATFGPGTGTASFQIVLNENGSFNVIVSQLSANWNATTSGAFAVSGAENIDGTQAFPVPGRNNTDWPGITPAELDCHLFNPIPCVFQRWQLGATTVSTNPSYTVSPSSTTTYTAVWNCGGTTCTGNTTVTVNTGLNLTSSTNSTNCATPNGSMVFNSNLPNGTYTLNYTVNGTPTTATITVTGNSFTMSNLNGGTYNNFTIGTGPCASSYTTPVVITTPTSPTTTSSTICIGGTPSLTSSACGTGGTPVNSGGVFNTGALTTTDLTWNRNGGGTTCNATAGTANYYDVFAFTVSTAGSYTLNGCFPNIDAHASLYQNAFNGANPCGVPANFIIADDDGNGALCSLDPRITANLTPGITYYLISTTFSAGSTDTYTWDFTGPGQITPGTGGSLQWYTAATGGSPISTISPFNPVGVAGSGLANTNTAGTYTYYAACSNAPTCRTAASVIISPTSTPPTSISGTATICHGQSVTLTAVGGTLAIGAQWQWFTGSCGGTLVGTGNSIVVSPAATTIYYVRASAGTSCPASTCITGTVTLPTAGTTLANNLDAATCVVNQNGYVHFYHSSGRLIVSVNSLGQNLGNVSVTAYTGAPVTMPACNFGGYVTAALGRHWVITPQFQPTTPIDVALHFDQSEFTALVPVANGNSTPQDNVTVVGDLLLSKYFGPLNVDGLASNNCVSTGGSGGTTIHAQASNAATSTLRPGFSATAVYTRHSIPSCSEFWLHGQTAFSPLATELYSFSANCEMDASVKLRWSTASESNCNNYKLEKSTDAGTWSLVQSIPCQGNSNTTTNYEVLDSERNLGLSYYRLNEIDNNGNESVIQIISVSCDDNNSNFIVYPNPTKNNFSVEVNLKNSIENAEIVVTDVSGKIVASKTVSLENGTTAIPFEAKELGSGTYLIYIKNVDHLKPIKLIIEK